MVVVTSSSSSSNTSSSSTSSTNSGGAATPIPFTKEHNASVSGCGFKIGDKVTVVSIGTGVIRYLGPLKAKDKISKKIYVGVEMDEAKGKSTGVFEDIQYFTCQPKRGLFVRLKTIKPLSSGPTRRKSFFELADKKQSSSTSAPSLCSQEEQKLFGYWNSIDRHEEREALRCSQQIDHLNEEITKKYEVESDMVDLMDTAISVSGSLSLHKELFIPPIEAVETVLRRKSTVKDISHISFHTLLEEPVNPDYKGPRLEGQPTLQFANALVDHYRSNLTVLLPRRYAAAILEEMEEYLNQYHSDTTVNYFEIPKKPDMQLIIAGDVHGQLNDVLWLFYKFGNPSPSLTYLFNGDIADRGQNAVEIFLLLFAFKIASPGSVIINRGNHESAEMNEIYGFSKEVRTKYGNLILQKFQSIFNLLPLCTVVEKQIFVVHGGLVRKDGVTLDRLNSINRKRSCPCSPSTEEDRLFFDLLWSDPRYENGRGCSGRGVDCVAFGPDVTESFLSLNQLNVCIRSHQVPTTLRGFEPLHEGRCVTLFSASNYCGTSGNYGGVIIFDPYLTFEIQEYIAPSLAEVREVHDATRMATAKVAVSTQVKDNLMLSAEMRAISRTRRASVANMEKDVLSKLVRLICENKTAIWQRLWNKDSQKSGFIHIDDLIEGMNASMKSVEVSVPWSLLIKKLNVSDSNDMICYETFLKKFRVEFRPRTEAKANWRFETVEQVFESIMKADLNLRETLMIFDRNCDGTVSYREFSELLNELKLGLSEPQMRLLMRIITAHYIVVPGAEGGSTKAADGGATEEETQGKTESVDRIDVAEFLGRFQVIYGHAIKDRKEADAKKSWISPALTAIGKQILADKAEAAQEHYRRVQETGNVTMYADGETMGKRRRSSALRSAALFQKFTDYAGVQVADEEGFLSYRNFITAIRQLPVSRIEKEIGFELTNEKLEELARAIDFTGTGRINYLEFLNAFHVADKNATTNVAEEMWEQLCASFYQQKVAIRCALARFDPDFTGEVDPEDFKAALQALNTVLGPTDAPLTSEQVDLVVYSIETHNGLINYEDFLDSFVVVDIFDHLHDGCSTSSTGAPRQLMDFSSQLNRDDDQQASSTDGDSSDSGADLLSCYSRELSEAGDNDNEDTDMSSVNHSRISDSQMPGGGSSRHPQFQKDSLQRQLPAPISR